MGNIGKPSKEEMYRRQQWGKAWIRATQAVSQQMRAHGVACTRLTCQAALYELKVLTERWDADFPNTTP
jgi:hypothetical protein